MVRFRLISTLIAATLLCGVASAQEFSVRANRGLNLRAEPSLNADIADTVSSGAVLQVEDTSGRWLKIRRDGGHAWLADWVNYTRIEDDTASDSEIDNCCFIDRQCNTDSEWISGYWAFQNKHCRAPNPLASTSLPANDAEGASPPTARPTVEGSEAFQTRVNAALDLLLSRAPQWYKYVTDGLNKIREARHAGVSGAYVDERTFDISDNHVFLNGGYERSVMWLASIIVHDACHVHQSDAGKRFFGRDAELECLQLQLTAHQAVDPFDRFASYLRTLIENINNPEYQWWH